MSYQYNSFKYNTQQYNASAQSFVLRLAESVSSADSRLDSVGKALAETITSSDAAVKYFQAAVKFEFIFLADTITKSIANKGLSETIRTNDWLQIERKGSQWSAS